MCETNVAPPGIDTKCAGVWKLARAEIASRYRKREIAKLETFDREAEIIQVFENNAPENAILCYKEKRRNDGWCRVSDEGDANSWGFCSSSCGNINNPVR